MYYQFFIVYSLLFFYFAELEKDRQQILLVDICRKIGHNIIDIQ